MNNRLAQFIDYKTGGNRKEFADIMGWSPQYLNKMLRGESIGIQPVVSLLQSFPELNARWLILGDGVMLDYVRDYVLDLLRLERYIPVMTRDELRALEEGSSTCFDRSKVDEWKARLAVRECEMRSRFEAAYKRQEDICRQSKVK